jgi:Na+/proline symporter
LVSEGSDLQAVNPLLVILLIAAYFALLIIISLFTSPRADNQSFFLANKKSPWYVVAYGMIGASLSGVTFISVPGWVGTTQFSYMQMVLGYLAGYTVIALILLPLYYRLNLTSIYTYLGNRFGPVTYKTGAAFFLLSRTLGSAFRLYIVARVLQIAVFDHFRIPFEITVLLTLLLILMYTLKGGIKTIVWTDTLQTTFMLLAVALTIFYIVKDMNLGLAEMMQTVYASDYSRIFFFNDWNDSRFFFRQFLAGAFIAIVMTGLDQDMMQKNLTCRTLKEAQKNMFTFSLVLVLVNLMFMTLGALLYIYTDSYGIERPAKADDLYPTLALEEYFSPLAGILFIIGLIAAAYSSADSALTALTTSFSIDMLNIYRYDEKKQIHTRKLVHLGVTLVMVAVIIGFNRIHNDSVISAVFTAAGYTYGPLLGLYAFGMFSRWKINDSLTPVVCLLAPLISYLLYLYSPVLLNGYRFGFELLIVNGLLTFAGLWLIRK